MISRIFHILCNFKKISLLKAKSWFSKLTVLEVIWQCFFCTLLEFVGDVTMSRSTNRWKGFKRINFFNLRFWNYQLWFKNVIWSGSFWNGQTKYLWEFIWNLPINFFSNQNINCFFLKPERCNFTQIWVFSLSKLFKN